MSHTALYGKPCIKMESPVSRWKALYQVFGRDYQAVRTGAPHIAGMKSDLPIMP